MLPRLKKRRLFLSVAQQKKYCAAHHLIVQAAPTEGVLLRVGFTASKRVGGAVSRNRAKRRLRALAEEMLSLGKNLSLDVVIIAKPSCVTAPFDELRRDLRFALKRLGFGEEFSSPLL